MGRAVSVAVCAFCCVQCKCRGCFVFALQTVLPLPIQWDNGSHGIRQWTAHLGGGGGSGLPHLGLWALGCSLQSSGGRARRGEAHLTHCARHAAGWRGTRLPKCSCAVRRAMR